MCMHRWQMSCMNLLLGAIDLGACTLAALLRSLGYDSFASCLCFSSFGLDPDPLRCQAPQAQELPAQHAEVN